MTAKVIGRAQVVGSALVAAVDRFEEEREA
jgi:hypothetical protein